MSAAKSDPHTCRRFLFCGYMRDQKMTDSGRERRIERCGHLVVGTYNRGDKRAAAAWLKLQTKAIKQRSPAQVQHMEACYFVTQGDADRERLVD